MIGQTIAHCKVTAKLGAGGIGEVYCATAAKLDHNVAPLSKLGFQIENLASSFSGYSHKCHREEDQASSRTQPSTS